MGHRVRPSRVRLALSAFGLAVAALPPPSCASPWNRLEGDLFAISRSAYYGAEGGAASAGTARRFEQVSYELYAEYGLTDRVMAGGKLIYAWQQVEGPGGRDALDGFAELEAFGQVQLRRGERGAVALLATVNAPTRTSSRLIEDRRFERDARVGGALLAGRSFGSWFASGRAGPDLSLGDDAHAVRAEATVGRRARLPLTGREGIVIGEAFLIQSLGGGGPEGADYSVLRAGPSVVVPLWGRMNLQLGGTVDLLGEDIDPGLGAFFSFWLEPR